MGKPLEISGSIEHKIFGSLLGIWIGFALSDPFPEPTWGGVRYLAYLLLLIGLLVVLLRITFSITYLRHRIVGYLAIFLVAGLAIPAIPAVSKNAFISPSTISEWKTIFIVPIFICWFLAAEISHAISIKLNIGP